MMRLFIALGIFVLPYVIYRVLAWLRSMPRANVLAMSMIWTLGGLLAASTIAVAALEEPRVAGGRYVPAAIKPNGAIAPAHVEPGGPTVADADR